MKRQGLRRILFDYEIIKGCCNTAAYGTGLLKRDFLVIVSAELVIKGAGDKADEFVADGFGEEVAKIHDGGVVF